MIHLRKITEENFVDAFHLKLAQGQERFVTHPVRSLAQAYVYRDQCQPFGIYEDDTMVGYVMAIYDYDIPEYDVWHMMIDGFRQGKGYGTAAFDQVLEYIMTKPFGPSNRVTLTCNKENSQALQIYKKRGFTETGEEDEDEIELSMTLSYNIGLKCIFTRRGFRLRLVFCCPFFWTPYILQFPQKITERITERQSEKKSSLFKKE